MPTTKRQLFNRALAKVTRKQISDVEEDSTEAKTCREMYPMILESVLTEHDWIGAERIIRLVQLSESPVMGFANAFQVPNDMIRLVQAYRSTNRQDFDFYWDLQGDQLHTDESTIYIRYTHNSLNVEQMNSNLVNALTYAMAIELCYPLNAKEGREAQIRNDYETLILPRAKALDSMQERFLEFEESPWVERLWSPGLGGHGDFS